MTQAKTAGDDEPGELLLQGSSITSGYLGESVASVTVDGEQWFATGDIARAMNRVFTGFQAVRKTSSLLADEMFIRMKLIMHFFPILKLSKLQPLESLMKFGASEL